VADEPLFIRRCEHGLPLDADCSQCLWQQHLADDQANDDDWMFDPLWKSSDG